MTLDEAANLNRFLVSEVSVFFAWQFLNYKYVRQSKEFILKFHFQKTESEKTIQKLVHAVLIQCTNIEISNNIQIQVFKYFSGTFFNVHAPVESLT